MKKKQWRIWFSIIIFMFMVIAGFTSCSKKEEKKIRDTKSLLSKKKEIYKVNFQNIDVDINNISDAYIRDDIVSILGIQWVWDKKEKFDKRIHCIVQYKMDGSYLRTIQLNGLLQREDIITFIINEKEQICFLTKRESEKEENLSYYLYIVNKKGKIIKKTKLKKPSISGVISMDSGNVLFSNQKVYVWIAGKIYKFNQKGKISDVYEINNSYIEHICQDFEGNFYFCGDYGLQKFNVKTEKIETVLNYGEHGIYRISSLSFKEDRIYLRDENYLYILDAKSGKLDTKFSWINNDINGENILAFLPLEDNAFFSISSFYDERKQKDVIELIDIRKAKNTKEKKILKFFCINLDSYVRSAIIEFNKTNKNYRVEIKDYEDYEEPEKQMNLDIIAGNIPDIIDVSGNISKKNLIKKGLFIDLYSLMKNDTEVTKEKFLPSILETLEVDHKLYYMPSSFYIQAFIAPRNKIGDMEGWSVEDMIKIYEDTKEHMIFMKDVSRQWFVKYIVNHQIDNYVDFSAGKVNFISDEFIKLLEFSKCFPDSSENFFPGQEETTQELVQKGKLMINPIQFPIFDVGILQYYTKLYAGQGGYTVLSYPSSDKNNKLCMFFDSTALTITTQCKDKEGAWEFVRQFLTYDYQKLLTQTMGIPTRKDAFDKILEYAMATKDYIDTDGTQVHYVASSLEGIPLDALSKEETEEIRFMVERVGICTAYDTARDDISAIVSDEVEAFFAEDKTAKEVAEIIQNRVKTYVSENL